jgi:hypothetical protein
MKRLILFSVVSLVFAATASGAVQQGDTELDFLGGWFQQNGDTSSSSDFDSFFLSAALGYFVTDNIQVQGAALGAWTSFGSGATETDLDVYAIGGRAKYHFMPTNQWVPYVGGQLFWANVDADAAGDSDGILAAGDSDGILWGPVLGLRYELNAYNDFFVEYQYHMWEGDLSDPPAADGADLDDGHGIFVGIIHQFK